MEDLTYAPNQLDRDVVAVDQIRTVIQTFRDRLFTEMFPNRSRQPPRPAGPPPDPQGPRDNRNRFSRHAAPVPSLRSGQRRGPGRRPGCRPAGDGAGRPARIGGHRGPATSAGGCCPAVRREPRPSAATGGHIWEHVTVSGNNGRAREWVIAVEGNGKPKVYRSE